MNTEAVYAALRDYVEAGLAELAGSAAGVGAEPATEPGTGLSGEPAGAGEVVAERAGGTLSPSGEGGSLLSVSPNRPDISLRVELAESACGEEWTGIRMFRLPSSITRKRYISGGALVDMTFQMLSKQNLSAGGEMSVTYATCLEKLVGTLRGLFKAGVLPALPDGLELRGVEAVQQSSLNYADSAFSGYVLDLRFTIKTRSI